jgi:lysyl-tRNA synthetase class 2
MSNRDPWRPTATIELLRRRAELLSRVRQFFDSRNFIEVQTPVLSHETIIDRYLDPIPVDVVIAGAPRRVYLQTSPELAMKRLLAAGASAIYQIGPAFRAGESGPRHNPEFTMLEWYRVGDSYQQGIQLLSEFAQAAIGAVSAEVLTYREAFCRFAEVDPAAADHPTLAKLLPEDVRQSGRWDRDDMLNWIMAHRIEPRLGLERPVIICDWPAHQAALANVRSEDPPVAERFELFIGGFELANGYHELIDPDELMRRMQQAQSLRIAAGHPQLTLPTRLHRALQQGIPDCCGVALGFDRLLMVREQCSSIADVLTFPIDRA